MLLRMLMLTFLLFSLSSHVISECVTSYSECVPNSCWLWTQTGGLGVAAMGRPPLRSTLGSRTSIGTSFSTAVSLFPWRSSLACNSPLISYLLMIATKCLTSNLMKMLPPGLMAGDLMMMETFSFVASWVSEHTFTANCITKNLIN